jgi:hypothetical protein
MATKMYKKARKDSPAQSPLAVIKRCPGKRIGFLLMVGFVLTIPVAPVFGELVINEIMFHPFESWPETQPYKNTNRTEYVEIYNVGTSAVELVDYRFDNGISFDFAPGMTLATGGYLVVCERLEVFTNAYPNVLNVVGDFGGGMNNAGERITLSRRDGSSWVTEDTFEYIDEDNADGTGHSLELVHPGFARLHDQYYGDWCSSSCVSGTPGVVNSVFDDTPLPVAGDVKHEPPLPPAQSVVTITARIAAHDGDSVSLAKLLYRRDTLPVGPFSEALMEDFGVRGDAVAADGIYTAVIPGLGDPLFEEGHVMEFRIEVTDTYGTRTFPATNRADVFQSSYSYFCKFGEDLQADVAYPGEYPTFHILMTQANQNWLQTRALQDDTLIDATFITDEGEVFYNCGVRFRGGSSRSSTYGGYRIDLPNGLDHDSRNAIDLNHFEAIREFIGMSIFDAATGGMASEVRLTRVFFNEVLKDPNQGIYVDLEGFSDSFVRRRYAGDLGNRYWADGDDRLGQLRYVGDSPSFYYNRYFININNPYTAWHEIIDFARILNQNEATYPASLPDRMNVRLWARHFATHVCVDNSEAGFGSPYDSKGDELKLYADSTNGVFDIFPWDMDAVIGSGAKIWDYGPGTAGPLVAKFLYNDPVLPYYAGDVYDIITTVMSHQNMTDLFDSMGSKMNIHKASYLSAITAQRNNLLGKISTDFTIDGHSPGSPFLWTDPTTQPISGNAPQTYTARVTVGGSDADWDLRPDAIWSLPAGVIAGELVQPLAIETIDSDGNVLASLNLTLINEQQPQFVGGVITLDTSWTATDEVVVIANNVIVSAGARLSVGPGVVVLIAPGMTLFVNGTLDIEGEAGQPAYFMPRSGGSDWTIQLSGGNASMTASNAYFGGGRIAVPGSGTLKLHESVVEHSQHAGGIISSTGGGNVHMWRSIVRDFAKTRFDSSPTLIEECLFENMSTSGIEFVGSASTSSVRRTTLRNSNGPTAGGVLFDATVAGLAENCLFDSIQGVGVKVNNAAASIVHSLFEGCGTGIETVSSPNVENINNTIAGGAEGVRGNQAVTNAIIWFVDTPIGAGSLTVAYSDIQQPGISVYPGTGNMNRNPWFKDEPSSDYRLQSISPARGGGLASEDMGASFPVGANPATPTGLSLDADTNALHLSWQDNSGNEETAFEIERSPDAINWVRIATVGANVTNFWDLGLAQNTLFHYRVRAVHARGVSFYSNPATGMTGIEDLTQLLIDNLRFTEFMYNPLEPEDSGEFIEIKNISQTETLDMSGVFLDNGRYTFPPGSSLDPADFFVLVRDPVAFGIAYPGVAIDGVYAVDDGLNNAGETLWIQDAGSNDIVRFRYEGGNNDPNWYPTTDGGGHSMVSVDPNPQGGDPNMPVYWRASASVGGSPAANDPNPGFGTIVINELLAHQDVPSGDTVELYNEGSIAVDLGGWFLSDDETSLRKYSFPPGTIIGASNYLLRTETAHFGTIPAGTNGFAFSELGDEIILSSGSGGSLTSYRTMEKFGATANNVTLGRHTRSDGEVDFVAMSGQTPAAANSLPRVGPIVISEIMYNPSAGGKEYVELLNTSPFPIPLYDVLHPTNTWHFDGAMEYTFQPGVIMAAGERVLVVSVEPEEFRQLYGLSGSPVSIFGPFAGDLNNSGDSVKLYYPGQPEPNDFVPRIRTDRVKYDDAPPWPTSADNGGPSLERKVALFYGNDPANWVAASMGGTPGMPNNTIGLPSVGFPNISSLAMETNQSINITMSLLPQVTSTVTVQYAVSGGSATRNSDYTFQDGTLIFWPYDTNHTVALTILDDTTPSGEPDETIEISIISVSSNAVIGGNGVYTHTIVDADATSLAAPTIAPSADTAFEGAILVSMAPNVANSDVYYTLDGSRPTRDDFLYQDPFILFNSARITARTFLGSANAGNWTSVLLTEFPMNINSGLPLIVRPLHNGDIPTPHSSSVEVFVDMSLVTGAVEQVEVFDGTTSIGVDTTEPYEIPWIVPRTNREVLLRAVMTDGSGMSTSPPVRVTTWILDHDPQASMVTDHSARMGGTLTGVGSAQATFFYGTSDGGTDQGTWQSRVEVGQIEEGAFSVDAIDLAHGETYFFRGYATNAVADIWSGPVSSFSTPSLDQWDRRMDITFDGYIENETLTNFPVLVVLSTNIVDFAYSQFGSSAGLDLRFTEGGETVPLAYEIEKWDQAGESHIWVQVPELSGPGDFISAYWGKTNATIAPQYSQDGSTWSEGYELVLHLNTDVSDSAPSPVSVTNVQTSPASGIVGGARDFNSTSESYLEPLIDAAWYGDHITNLTISIWGHPDSIMPKSPFGVFGGASDSICIKPSRGSWSYFVADKSKPGSPIQANEWQMLGIVLDDNTALGYHNDTQLIIGNYADFVPPDRLRFGDNNGDASQYFDGILDEARISRVARSPAWMRASYMTIAQNQLFASYLVVSNTPFCPYSVEYCEYINRYPVADEDPDTDSDGDGATNYEEYIAGTDPNDPNDVFQVLAIDKLVGSNCIWWMSGTNSGVTTDFSLLRMTNLVDLVFEEIANGIARDPSGTNVFYDVSPPEAGAYYRPVLPTNGN